MIVDLFELRLADSSLDRGPRGARSAAARRGRRLRLRAPQPQIRTLIELVGLHRMSVVALELAL
ncbi:MAG: hypothetical protein H0V22_11010 [Solirubrobacterales bacterium]|nr:hypothetical protein [Solirubrobacterales bacterium]